MANQPTVCRTLLQAFVVFVSIWTLSGCGTTGSSFPNSTSGRITPTPQLAASLVEQGDAVQAAHMYAQLASQELNPQLAAQYQLQATELYFDSELYAEALRAFDALPTGIEATTDPQRLQLLQAYVELARGETVKALELLPQSRALSDRALRVRALEIEARAKGILDDPVAALKARILIEANLTAPAAIARNRVATRNLLNGIDEARLRQMATVTGGSIYRGWIEYTLLQRQSKSDENVFAQQTEAWNARYPGHPAAARVVDTSYDDLQTAAKAISTDRVALLLPLSGNFHDVGNAIKNGFLAARFNANPASVSTLRFYDTKSDVRTAVKQYELAAREGASLIIGPLEKAAVTRLAANNRISVPTLSLNYTTSDIPPVANLYQFGLLPEDEARDAAQYILNQNLQKALVVVADSPLGNRLAGAFTSTFEQHGGSTLAVAKVPPDSYDYSREIKTMLSINESNARRRQLQKLLDTKVEFEPAIRGDAEIIFMAVDSDQARLLRPQLQFHHASHLPLVSTSRIFSGEVDERADSDLSGIVYCEIPWVIDERTASSRLLRNLTDIQPETPHGLYKLQGLGIDAWTLHSELETMRFDRAYSVGGVTGQLTLDTGNRIRRRLQWATFEEGKPVKIADALPVKTVLQPLTAETVN